MIINCDEFCVLWAASMDHWSRRKPQGRTKTPTFAGSSFMPSCPSDLWPLTTPSSSRTLLWSDPAVLTKPSCETSPKLIEISKNVECATDSCSVTEFISCLLGSSHWFSTQLTPLNTNSTTTTGECDRGSRALLDDGKWDGCACKNIMTYIMYNIALHCFWLVILIMKLLEFCLLFTPISF